MTSPEELVILINTLAIAISKDKTIPQLNVLAAAFEQIADTLVTIAIQRANIEECLGVNKDTETVTEIII